MINAGAGTNKRSNNNSHERINDIRSRTSTKRDAEARKNMEELRRQKAQKQQVEEILKESTHHQKPYTQQKIDGWVKAELTKM